MNTQTRQRWLRATFGCLAASAVGLVLISPGGVEGQAADPPSGPGTEAVDSPPAQPTDELLYQRVQQMRLKVGLTRESMAAMDMDTAQSRAVLEQLQSWAASRGPLLEQVQNDRRGNAREHAALMREINLGTAAGDWRRQQQGLRRDALELAQREQALYDEAASAVASILTAEQSQMRAAARRQGHLQGGLRYLPIDPSTTPRPGLLAGGRSGDGGPSATPSAQERAARGLTDRQRSLAETYQQRMSKRWEDVAQAEREVFFGEQAQR